MILLFILKLCTYPAILMCLATWAVQLYIKAEDQDTLLGKFFGFYLAIMTWVFTLMLICWVSYDIVMSVAEILGGTL